MRLFEMISYAVVEPFFKPAAAEIASVLLRGADSGDTEWSQQSFMSQIHPTVDKDDYGERALNSELEKDWEAWLLGYTEDLVREAFENITAEFETQGDMIKLFREITAPKDWVVSGGLTKRPVGVYWSYVDYAVEAHWGTFDQEHYKWTIVAWFPIKNIDWTITLIQNGTPSYSEEKEVRIIEGALGVIESVSFSWPSHSQGGLTPGSEQNFPNVKGTRVVA